MAIVPCGHRVLVKKEKLEDVDPVFKSAGVAGIIIPDGQNKDYLQNAVDKGIVVDIGPTAFRGYKEYDENNNEHPGKPWCKVGDLVAFAKYAGKAFKEDDIEYLVLNDDDIVAVLRS